MLTEIVKSTSIYVSIVLRTSPGYHIKQKAKCCKIKIVPYLSLEKRLQEHEYSWPLNSMDLNSVDPLILGVSSINTVVQSYLVVSH